MNLKIGENLRRFRRERELTQEEVASHLGVSFQAVSKWERNESYPDITLLPSLANYFHVSVDALIGMEDVASAAQRDDFNRRWEENRAAGLHAENVALMKEALAIFPNDALLLVQLSASLERLDGTDAERREYLRQSIEVQEQILRHTADSEVRGAVLFNIADAYWRYGDNERAYAYAAKLPNLYKTRETALVRILPDGEARRAAARDALDRLAWLAEYHMRALGLDGSDIAQSLRSATK